MYSRKWSLSQVGRHSSITLSRPYVSALSRVLETKSHPFIHSHHFSLRHNSAIIEAYIFESFLLCNLSSSSRLHLHLPTPNILSSIVNFSNTLTNPKHCFPVINIASNVFLPPRLVRYQLCTIAYLQQPCILTTSSHQPIYPGFFQITSQDVSLMGLVNV